MKIVLMRASTGCNDEYVNTLNKIGDVTSIPVLSFNFCNCDLIKDAISAPDSWSGIIFTSKRSVEAVQLSLDTPLSELWASKPCYAVGESTAKMAENLGFISKGGNSGNAQVLAELIVQEQKLVNNQPLLFICGQLKRETLPSVLTCNEIPFHTITAYETVKNPVVDEAVQSYVEVNGSPDFITFFSPSGHRFCFNTWQSALKGDFSATKIVAIGETTAHSFASQPDISVVTAERPNPESLFKIIKANCESS
uniref:Uroporphyrinogen-III synthase n=1 Tax=Ciona intestinalis TaxID=7719 RepID=F7AD29_CIOIN|nr:uroporphyrinogen-III synthase-like [Ciona intestinalis]|eukprot:XP_002128471.1 uroporphyrinogen-III synthase-like [Ciona intestinalis]